MAFDATPLLCPLSFHYSVEHFQAKQGHWQAALQLSQPHFGQV